MPAQWTCPTCSKEFQRKGDLTRHQHLHTGYKPHVCESCGKAFAQFTGLKTHRNVHTRERPYSCNICSATFSDPSSCARHRRETHMNPSGHKCYIPGCNTSIKRRSCFTKHLKEKHGVDFEHTKIKIETDFLEFSENLYQISSPDSSSSPSGSDSSSVDVAPWADFDCHTPPDVNISQPAVYQDGSVLFASSAWASLPSAAIDTSTNSFLSHEQVDLHSTIDTTIFFNNLFPGCFESSAYEYPGWSGTPSSSTCSSLSSSPAPSTPEDTSSDSIPEEASTRYANFFPVRSSKDAPMPYPYTPFEFGTIV